MVLAGQAMHGRITQHTAQHPAQRVARQHIVSNMIGRHDRSCILMGRAPVPDDRAWWAAAFRLAFVTWYSGQAPRSAAKPVRVDIWERTVAGGSPCGKGMNARNGKNAQPSSADE
ncbi:hypothetical protein SSBR45G_43690 [Bradyrhizobium sp. SSBR45G]|nr:hypothetical protein SSBR45G_43690 [Bradyrhizobium sp. SSBR45G]GLH86837.1 hypothetical protein SSBR45R_42970 [Bradyrhizobium sp. SSBR45R]